MAARPSCVQHTTTTSQGYRERFYHTWSCLRFQFKKAFDKVPHNLLMRKIRGIDGINHSIVNWIQNFTDRRQRVTVRGSLPTDRPGSSGMPQGSVLGPSLFLIYINYLPHSVTCNVSLYADDTLLHSEVNIQQDEKLFQMNIDALYRWSSRWKMPFNTGECEVVIFGKGQAPTPGYTLGGIYTAKMCARDEIPRNTNTIISKV